MFTFIRKIHKPVSFTLALLLLASCNSTTSVVKDTQKPNVIYIMADDLTMQAISAYGGLFKDIAPTPNIDRLAKEGMLFNDVICTNAICGPSRACILTGKYAHVNGYYKNEYGGVFNEKQWTFPQEFKKNGYQTSLFGKWHLGTNPVGFDTFKFHSASAQQGLYWNPVYNVNGKDEKFKGYATNLSTDFAMNWLESERDQTKPFMMILQYKAPHRPWEPDKKYEKLWDDIEMPYPSNFNDNYVGREKTAGDTELTMEHFSRKDMKLKAPDSLKGKDLVKWNFYGTKNEEIVTPEGMSFEEGRKWRYQTYIKDYLACVKSVDDNIGRVLKYLDDNNLTENTVVVLTSDQGFFLGEHGFFDKRFIYEETIRMPFIVRYPKMVKPSTVNNDIVRNIDFAPTLLDLANIKADEKLQGVSFKPLLLNKTPKNWNQAAYYHYYEFPYWHHVQPHYGIRTQKYTLAHFYYNIDVWEFYDLEKDPMQMNNAINDPKYKDVIVELKKQLKGLMVEAGNDLSLDEYRIITDKDFGSIIERNGDDDVNSIINGKK
ncbi:sulfatase-like hydrolase/transferase [Flavobacterium sp. LMO8]|uniref:sulfatase family protein n=1 Tax=Flavobacterium sp. LMO8 TaxID=2654244 RepID=UPI001291EF07|nr:sulfatase [Flavobacterium sp. LMO8]MQP25657.1 sulfatase-like hydrolase/transferase [Flavobacterium sp. LMO8]